MFPVDAFCNEYNQFETVLDQQYEERLLDNGASRFANDRIEDNDSWAEVNGTAAERQVQGDSAEELRFDASPSRAVHGEYHQRLDARAAKYDPCEPGFHIERGEDVGRGRSSPKPTKHANLWRRGAPNLSLRLSAEQEALAGHHRAEWEHRRAQEAPDRHVTEPEFQAGEEQYASVRPERDKEIAVAGKEIRDRRQPPGEQRWGRRTTRKPPVEMPRPGAHKLYAGRGNIYPVLSTGEGVWCPSVEREAAPNRRIWLTYTRSTARQCS
jgi:hypothetical protein